jgi:GNAT superfamily N-acetyltransferase
MPMTGKKRTILCCCMSALFPSALYEWICSKMATAGFRRGAILKEAQRRGYGRALMSPAERFASRHGRTRFIADVATDAVGFWERIGYRQVTTDVPDDGPRMEKRHAEA